VTCLWSERSGVRVPAEAKDITFLQISDTGSGVPFIRYGCSFPALLRPHTSIQRHG
jgi:hypothetical protein